MTTPCINTKGKILRFAQDDNSKRFNFWKEIVCSLMNGDTFPSPPPNTTTMRRGGEQPTVQVLRFAQDDNSKRFDLRKVMGCSLSNDHSFGPTTSHNTTTRHCLPERSEGPGLLNIAVWRHFASIQKSRSFASLRMTVLVGWSFASLGMTLQRGLTFGKQLDAAWCIALWVPENCRFDQLLKDFGCRFYVRY